MSETAYTRNFKAQLKEKALKRKQEAERKLDEIEDILLDLPFTDPKFETLVQERNNLLIII